MNRTQFQASNPARQALGYIGRLFAKKLQRQGALRGAKYPEIPAAWPNRAVRRAVKLNCESRLPAEWRQFLAINSSMRGAIKAL
jgi:hypothetical protein